MNYNKTQLRILWYLKQHGPIKRTTSTGYMSLVTRLSDALEIKPSLIRYNLKVLEEACVILRTYAKGKPATFEDARGNTLLSIELVDPTMSLPPKPVWNPTPVVVVDAQENEELYESSLIEPSQDSVILALLERNDELTTQITKLQDVIQKLTAEKRSVPEHLTSRVRDALTPEQWDQLTHRFKR